MYKILSSNTCICISIIHTSNLHLCAFLFCTWFDVCSCSAHLSAFFLSSNQNIQHLTDWINALKWSPFVQKKMALGKKNCKKKRVLFYEIEDGQILLSGIPVIYCCCTFGQPCHYHLIGKCLDNRFRPEFGFQVKLVKESVEKFWMEFIFHTLVDELIMPRLSKSTATINDLNTS